MTNYLFLIIAFVFGLTLAVVAWVLKAEAARGWLPLAEYFPLTHRPTGPETRLRWVSVGGSGVMGHRGAVAAGASAAGLSLRMPLLAWVWHPPLLILWSAFGPFRAEKRLLWKTRCTTTIRLPNGTAVPLRFEDANLLEAVQSWTRLEGAR